eukprot:GFUD01002758.1.p1 GENE.GFUD01002758.1~~GFUD01002758.1.p1  ORF type:complete len:422 (+),score=88.37 GFUD01002758.1:84-1349(+)
MEETSNLVLRSLSPPFPPTTAPPSLQFSPTLTLFAAVSAIVLCLVGVSGNLLTVVALTRDRKLRQQATTSFVISLAFSDLLFCAINLPLTAIRYIQQEWTLGPVLCRIFPFFFYGNVAASLMSMVAITINRYVLIAYYGNYSRIYSPCNILLMIAAVWIFSFGMIFPPLVDMWGTLGLDEETFSCTIKKLDGKSPKKFLFLVAFLLPSISIMVCYSAILYTVKASRQKLEAHCTPGSIPKTKAVKRSQNIDDLKLTKMMLTIFLLFLICFLPLMLVNVWDDEIRQPSVHIVASVLAWMSAAINPFIYAFLNQQYQLAFRTLLCLANPRLATEHTVSECYSIETGTPMSSKSCSLASSMDIKLKLFSKEQDFSSMNERDVYNKVQLGQDFSIVNEGDVHTQMQLKKMGHQEKDVESICHGWC